MLVIVIYRNEMARKVPPSNADFRIIKARTDRNVQQMMDSIRLAREMNVNTPGDIEVRLEDVGVQMNGLKRERARLKACVEHQQITLDAWRMYSSLRGAVEGVSDPDPDIQSEYRTAYAILAHNRILSAEAFQELNERQQFQLRKIDEYAEKLETLRKQYRGLKKLQSLVTRAERIAEQSYLCKPEISLDDRIKAAAQQQCADADVQSIFNHQKNNRGGINNV